MQTWYDCAYNLSTWEVEAGGSVVQGYHWLSRKFKPVLGMEEPVSKAKQNKIKKEMAQYIKALASKPDDLSSVLGPHSETRELTPKVVLCLPHMCWATCVPTLKDTSVCTHIK